MIKTKGRYKVVVNGVVVGSHNKELIAVGTALKYKGAKVFYPDYFTIPETRNILDTLDGLEAIEQ